MQLAIMWIFMATNSKILVKIFNQEFSKVSNYVKRVSLECSENKRFEKYLFGKQFLA